MHAIDWVEVTKILSHQTKGGEELHDKRGDGNEGSESKSNHTDCFKKGLHKIIVSKKFKSHFWHLSWGNDLPFGKFECPLLDFEIGIGNWGSLLGWEA